MAETIIFNLTAKDVNLGALLVEKREQVRRLNIEFRKASEGTAEFKKLGTQIAGTKAEIADLTKRQKDLNASFSAAKFPKGSLLDLRNEYGKLAKQIEQLGEAERKSAFGQGIIKNASKLKTEINGIEQSIGRFQGNVGNYKAGLSAVGDQLTGGLATGGIVAAVGAVTTVLKISAEQAFKYEQSLADLSALTGKTGQGLKEIENIGTALQEIQIGGAKVVSTGPDILNALKLVGGARPELLKSAEALGEVTKNAIILSKASGDGLEPSVIALTSVLGQFDLKSSESSRVINELAAAAKEGASEIPQTTDALQRFGNVAAISNVSTGESIALIELLADKQLKGAEAGTQLRAVFAKLSGAKILPPEAQAQFDKYGISADVLADKSLSLDVRLRELSKAQGDAAALTKIFGLENLTAATIITSGTKKYSDLLQSIEGTSEALKQAEIRAGTTNQALENLGNGISNHLGKSFFNLKYGLNEIVKGFVEGTDAISKFGAAVNQVEPSKNLNLNPGKDTRTAIDPFAQGGSLQSVNSLSNGDITRVVDENKKAVINAAEEFKILAETGGVAEASISALKSKLKELKKEIGSAAPGSPTFDLLSKQIRETSAQLKKEKVSAGIIQASGPGKNPEIKAAAGSIDDLQKRVNDLNTKLQKAPKGQVMAILGDLVEAEANLKLAVEQLDRLKKSLKEVLGVPPDVSAGATEIANAKINSIVNDLFAGKSPNSGVSDTTSVLMAAGEAQRIASVENNAAIVEDEKFTAEQILQLQIDLQDRTTTTVKQGLKDRDQLEKEAEDKKRKRAEDLRAAAFLLADGVGQFIVESGRARQSTEEQQKRDALQREYDDKIAAANGNVAQETQIKKDFEAKKLEIDRASSKERQKLAVKEALINTALAIIRALATGNIFAAGAAAILGGLQVAAIKKQSFARGGYTGKGSGQPDHTGHRVVDADLHEGEYVSPKWMVDHPVYGKDIAYLDRVRRRSYATGGFVNAPLKIGPVTIPGEGRPQTVGIDASTAEYFAQVVAKEVAAQVREAAYQGTAQGGVARNRDAERNERMKENRSV